MASGTITTRQFLHYEVGRIVAPQPARPRVPPRVMGGNSHHSELAIRRFLAPQLTPNCAKVL